MSRICENISKTRNDSVTMDSVLLSVFKGNGGNLMAVSYDRLWKLLIDKKMSKGKRDIVNYMEGGTDSFLHKMKVYQPILKNK